MGVDASAIKRTFLKFTVSGLTEPVTSAKLRMHATTSAARGSNSGGTWRVDDQHHLVGDRYDLEQPARHRRRDAGHPRLGRPQHVVRDRRDLAGHRQRHLQHRRDLDQHRRRLLRLAGERRRRPAAGGHHRHVAAPPPVRPRATRCWSARATSPTPAPGDTATAALLDGIPGTVFTAGDNVYDNGTASEFATYYDPTWGRHKARTRPAPGNHDYNTSGATGYYNYFGAQAGPSGRGYYSYDLGNWHVVSLNSEVSMSAGSAQEQWLRADLAASTKPCTLAYWHQPLFTSGANHAPATSSRPARSRRCTTTTPT